jgi:undecaprenyl-diphosphatase
MELLWKIVSAIILALVEGITEFLPVSSTGHMILVRELLDLDVPPGGVFEVFIQFGAILSICLIYFDYLWKVTKAVPFNENARRFAFGLFVAFLPAAILGVLLSDFITTYLFSKYVVAVSLVVGGFAILYIERLVKIPQYYSVEDFPLSLYLKIGLCQCVAMIPGVSRSGATIMGSLLMKVERSAAAEFSFFLAIPTMFGASAYSLYKHWHELHSSDFLVLGIGFVVAFISAYYVARMFLSFVANNGFGVFAWYRIFIGTLMLSYLFTKEYILA